MPKGSPELTNKRREEIINACKTLYKTLGFREITIKEIGNVTSFTRTSIYNYFQTKEEIFLALLQREYELWTESIENKMSENDAMTKEDFADMLALTLEKRSLLLKLLSMNHYDMESNSREENLAQFKVAYGNSIKAIENALNKYFPEMSQSRVQNFIYTFYPFLFGIYPYTEVTEKQRNAMDKAGIKFLEMSVYEITYNCIKNILKF